MPPRRPPVGKGFPRPWTGLAGRYNVPAVSQPGEGERTMTTPLPLRRWMLAVFVLSLAVRALYVLVAWNGPESIRQPDTAAFERPAINLAEHFAIALTEPDGRLTPFTERPPIYIGFLALARLLGAGDGGVLAAQIVIDSLTVLMVGLLAQRLRPGLALPAALASALNPSQIIHAAILLSDSMFLLPFTAFLWAMAGALARPSLRRVALAATLLGISTLTRPTSLYFIPVAAVVVTLAAGSHGWRRRVGWMVTLLAIAGGAVVPWVVRNGVVANHYAYSHQNGVHAMYWLVPLTKEYGTGVPAAVTVDDMNRRLAQELERRGMSTMPELAFDQAALMGDVAIAAMREIPLTAMLRAWVAGSAINMGAPAVIASPLVQSLPRPSFYATPGDTFLHKVVAYVTNPQSGTFALVLAAGLAFNGAILLLAGRGAVRAVRLRLWRWQHVAFLAILVGYIFALTGPITGIKYRLPIEPALMALLAEGLLAPWWRRRRAGTA